MVNQKKKSVAVIGRKLGMTQVWDEAGYFIPVSVVEIGTNVISQIRTQEVDGYEAIQLAFGEVDPQKVTKPIRGHFEKAGLTPRRYVMELRTEVDKFELGQEIGVDAFKDGDQVDVSGITKGKGFAGTMKRYNFKGVSSSHGAHKNHRKPGSVGACATPGRVFKGLRMSGHMGVEKQTTLNLKIQQLDGDRGFLMIKGAIPGPKNGIVLVRSAVKA